MQAARSRPRGSKQAIIDHSHSPLSCLLLLLLSKRTVRGFYSYTHSTKNSIVWWTKCTTTHVRGTPVLKHSKNVAELDLKRKASFPFWLYCNVLTKLALHLLHALIKKVKEGCESINIWCVKLVMTQYHSLAITHHLRMNQGWDHYYLHAFEKPKKDFEPLYELCPQLFSPYWGFTDQNVPERDTSYISVTFSMKTTKS